MRTCLKLTENCLELTETRREPEENHFEGDKDEVFSCQRHYRVDCQTKGQGNVSASANWTAVSVDVCKKLAYKLSSAK